jgi:hypothetical protein
MANSSVVSQSVVSATGLVPVMTAPGSVAGDIVDCDGAAGRNIVVVNNASGAPITVTVNATGTQDGLAIASRVYTVAAGAIRHCPVGPARTFGRPSGADVGRAYVDYSAVASVTRAVVLIPSSY